MNSSSFLRADGALDTPRPTWWSEWLPSLGQIQQAIQPQFGPEAPSPAATWAITMRQGLGLVVISALLAGFLPFLFNSVTAIRLGTVLPLAEQAQQAQEQSDSGASISQMGDTWQRLAGLPPAVLPSWLAALLSSLGEWINWPLRWLTWWLVYGTATLLAAKVWNAPTTLQRFLGATSYAAVPMILTGLGPIPCLGIISQIIAVIWMFVVYCTSVRAVTGLDWGRAIIAVILPAAIISLLGIILSLAIVTSVLRAIF
jgi:hypothetical protein